MKKCKCLLSLVLAVALVASFGGLIPAAALEPELYEVYEFNLETSAPGISLLTLEDGVVEMKPTNEVRWIDRIADLPEEMRTFYNALVEYSDNDGVDDLLITDAQFDSGIGIAIASVPIVVTGSTQEEINASFQAAFEDVVNRYVPYIFAVMAAFDRDHPEVFWLNGLCEVGASASYDGTGYVVGLELILQEEGGYQIRQPEFPTEAAIKEAIADLDTAANAVLTGAAGKSDYETLRHFNNYLIMNNEYNTSTDLSTAAIGNLPRTPLGAMEGSSGISGPVCEGYARAFKVLCDRAGIPCVLADGQATDGVEIGAHMWNAVQMDGSWYAADVTWNDPVGGTGIVSGVEREDWLLIGGNTRPAGETLTFAQSHMTANRPNSSVPSFLNGPVLSETAYEPAVVTPAITDNGRSLSLEGEIFINQYVGITGLDDVAYIQANGGLLVWHDPIDEADALFGSEDDLRPGLIHNGGTEFAQQTKGIVAKAYADELYLRVYLKLEDGSYIYGPLQEYSVQDYCEGRLLNSPNQKLKDTCAALLHYGAAAQVYFGYNTADLANANILAAYPAAEWDPSLLTDLVDPVTNLVGTDDVQDKGKSLSLEGELMINFYFAPTDAGWTVERGTLQIWEGVTEELTEANVSYTVDMKAADGSEWAAQSEGIAAKEYSNTIYAQAVLTDTEGGAHYSDVVAYSVEEYAAGRIANSSNPNMVELVKKLVTYGNCADIYFAK